MNLGRSLTYMFADENWLGKIAILVLLAIFSIFILPIFIIFGYSLAIAANAYRGLERLPSWDNLGQYLSDGFKLAIVLFVYNLIPIGLWVLFGIMLGAMGSDYGGSGLDTVMLALSVVLGLITLVYALFVTPAAFVLFLQSDGSWSGLFDLQRLLSVMLKCMGPLVTVLIMGLVVTIGVGLVSTILGLIPCLGQILALGLSTYPMLVLSYLYGQLARTCPA